MTKAEAIRAIKESLARGSSTPFTWAANREAYIAEQSAQLLQSVFDPVLVSISGETHNYGVKDQLTSHPVFGIARREGHWLLYSPELHTFSLAFGNDEKALIILGFAS